MIVGKYTKKFVDDYCVLDTETTGLEPEFCEIIEISILRIRSGRIKDEYNTLIKPNRKISSFITELTCITNEMVENEPSIEEVSNDIFEFIGNDFLIGHNTSFDLRFLANATNKDITNAYNDTMLIGRKLIPELKHHRLKDLCKYYHVTAGTHRARTDTLATYKVYEEEKETFKALGVSEHDFFCPTKITKLKNLVVQDESLIDTNNFFYGLHCCFTGTLEKMKREEAAQRLVNIGGFADSNVTKHTDCLILGSLDYCSNIKGDKSSKYKKAEELQLKGQEIMIISEKTFYEYMNIE